MKLSSVIFITSFKLPKHNKWEKSFATTIMDIIMNKVMVINVDPKWKSNTKESVLPNSRIINDDISHLIIPFSIIRV